MQEKSEISVAEAGERFVAEVLGKARDARTVADIIQGIPLMSQWSSLDYIARDLEWAAERFTAATRISDAAQKVSS